MNIRRIFRIAYRFTLLLTGLVLIAGVVAGGVWALDRALVGMALGLGLFGAWTLGCVLLGYRLAVRSEPAPEPETLFSNETGYPVNPLPSADEMFEYLTGTDPSVDATPQDAPDDSPDSEHNEPPRAQWSL